MITWILIILAGGGHATAVEFHSQPACESAREAVMQTQTRINLKAICVKDYK